MKARWPGPRCPSVPWSHGDGGRLKGKIQIRRQPPLRVGQRCAVVVQGRLLASSRRHSGHSALAVGAAQVVSVAEYRVAVTVRVCFPGSIWANTEEYRGFRPQWFQWQRARNSVPT
jgi:hypothetical protein